MERGPTVLDFEAGEEGARPWLYHLSRLLDGAGNPTAPSSPLRGSQRSTVFTTSVISIGDDATTSICV